MAAATPVLLIDEDALVRESLRLLIRARGDYAILDEAASGMEALLCPGAAIVVTEADLPGFGGLDLIARLPRLWPGIKIVVFSNCDDERTVAGAIRAGASAYVHKKASGRDLLEALDAVRRGESYFSPGIAARLAEMIRRGAPEERSIQRFRTLSHRERQVLRLVAEGKTSKEAATALNLTPQTIRSYRKAVMRKLSVTNAAGLTRIAIAAEFAGHETSALEDRP